MEFSELLALAAFTLSFIAAIWKAYELIGNLERKLIQVSHENEKLELTLNGIRERMEHIQTRISARQREQELEMDSVQNWLAKNTAYEIRGELK